MEESYKTLKQFVKEATTAVIKDSYETLKNQSRMVDYIADQSEYVATSIAALNQIIDTVQISEASTCQISPRPLLRLMWLDRSATCPDKKLE